MKLPAAAYSAEVATSATKAGSCGVSCEILRSRYPPSPRLWRVLLAFIPAAAYSAEVATWLRRPEATGYSAKENKWEAQSEPVFPFLPRFVTESFPDAPPRFACTGRARCPIRQACWIATVETTTQACSRECRTRIVNRDYDGTVRLFHRD